MSKKAEDDTFADQFDGLSIAEIIHLHEQIKASRSKDYFFDWLTDILNSYWFRLAQVAFKAISGGVGVYKSISTLNYYYYFDGESLGNFVFNSFLLGNFVFEWYQI